MKMTLDYEHVNELSGKRTNVPPPSQFGVSLQFNFIIFDL